MTENGYAQGEVKMQDLLIRDLSLDSIGILSLADELEDKFNIEIDFQDLEKVPETISDMIQIVLGKVNQS